MKKRWHILFVIALVLCYLLGPVVAGALRVGAGSGPVLYAESFHAAIYIACYEAFHNEKPREPLDGWMYHRPLFYGLSRRLKSQKEREEYIEMARRNGSPRVPQLIEMSQKLDGELNR